VILPILNPLPLPEGLGSAKFAGDPGSVIIIHLLGEAPVGFSTAPDNGPWAIAEVVHVGTPLRRSG
jgi:hypothetical protein